MMRYRDLALFGLVAAVGLGCGGDGASPIDAGAQAGDGGAHATGDRFLDGFFPIGVFGQPANMLETWRDRGCNTMLEIPQGQDQAAWDLEAQRLGLRMIRRPIADPDDDRLRHQERTIVRSAAVLRVPERAIESRRRANRRASSAIGRSEGERGDGGNR